MYRDTNRINWVAFRIALVAAFFALGTVLLMVRAYRLQVGEAETLRKRATKQRTRVLQVEGRRGMILDRSGEQIAASLEVSSIYARPRRVSDHKGTARTLAGILKTDTAKMLSLLRDNRPFVWIRRRVSPLITERVTQADLEGVFTVKEYQRFYPLKSLAAHAVGFAGIDSNGLEGLELFYDRDLRAGAVPVTAPRDALGRPVMFTSLSRGPKRRDVHLTLDRGIQYVAEKELEEAVDKHRARYGVVVVMDADTGEILALAGRPTYNLNVFQKAPASVRRNRSVADTFEPGSTFKVFLAATVLDLGRVDPSERFFCHRGRYRIHGHAIHDIVPRGRLSFEQVIVHSSNIGAVKISERLSKSEFYRVLRGFGFGSPSGVDLPGERSGVLLPPGKWNALTKANIAFGQGISVNAVQLTAAFAAAINGGKLYRPHLMKKVSNRMGEPIRENRPVLVRRVIKPSTSATLVKILRRVIVKGTGKAAAIRGVEVVGKTGTAQKADPAGGYSRNRYVASFVGGLTTITPRVVIFVMIDEPKGTSRTGGKVAAPVFRGVAKGILSLLGKTPSEPRVILASQRSTGHRAFERLVKQVDLRKGPRRGEWIVPDLTGLSMRQVLDVCAQMKCDASFSGAGWAVTQDPQPGSVFREGAPLRVTFGGDAS